MIVVRAGLVLGAARIDRSALTDLMDSMRPLWRPFGPAGSVRRYTDPSPAPRRGQCRTWSLTATPRCCRPDRSQSLSLSERGPVMGASLGAAAHHAAALL